MELILLMAASCVCLHKLQGHYHIMEVAMCDRCFVARVQRVGIAAIAMLLMLPALALAQSPWERAANNLAITFTGPLARSLALVAIVIGGLLFMFGEGGAKRQLSGIVFGGGLALFAGQFLTWLF
ncbi:MAG TPA: TrbC/VirB2 family protein [Vicinamibacterales bacterium]|nr:TrbC/VirB2 family protein [Vicinamibacterales bacterium]